ncbi:DNA primase [Radiobacillus deserti]|uniref:DNA primase n=1 Tax=Radiobacillus deserti TaxID=2594883 RepID=A0A516KGW6_9BACI|nr:DNA primase [Radiobacillus deserti]QDP40634.1 DNA primase [Radiobacillus deserti]
MASQIPEELVEEIRKANDIVDVIGEYVQLKKQGRNFFGLCPFHGEKTPSFSVTQDKQIFHCFGCGKGGNVVTFLMEIEGFNFSQAIRFLADKSGHVLPKDLQPSSQEHNQDNQDVISANEWLTKLYHHLLRHSKDGKEAYQYLINRGFTEESINTFQLGFAPNSKDFTAQFLEKKGFHLQQMVKAGLLSAKEDQGVTDRFRGRVMFPIRNHLGKTIAFGGRALNGQEPKYLNSPESDLFRKGTMLYNFDLARPHIRREQEVVLFEGYVDVISAYNAGIQNGVATLGTSITEAQAKLLRRYVDQVTICYDGDEAGIQASFKAAKLLKQVGCMVKVSHLTNGLDPDEFIQTYGAERFKNEIIKASDTYTSFMMRYIKKDYNLKLEGDRIQYVEKVLDEIALIEKPIEREHYLKELSNEFNLSMDTLTLEIEARLQKLGNRQDKGVQNRHTNTIKSKRHATGKLLPAYHNAERQLLSYMLSDETIAGKVQEELGGNFNVEKHKVIVTYLYAFYEGGNAPDVSQFVEELPDSELQSYAVELALIPTQSDISDREISDYINTIRTEQNDHALIKSLKEDQKLAEQQSDPLRAAEIAMKILDIQRQIRN